MTGFLNFLKHASSFIEKVTILHKVISITLKISTNVRNKVQIPLLVLVLLFVSFKPTGIKIYKIDKIVIDAGHGGKDPGTLGEISKEKDVALKIALDLGRIIKENLKDVQVVYTRQTDKFVELENRASIANKDGADLFISIHCNAVKTNRDNIHGTMTFVMGLGQAEGNLEVAKRENSVILLEDNYKERYAGFDPNSKESYILFSNYQNAMEVVRILKETGLQPRRTIRIALWGGEEQGLHGSREKHLLQLSLHADRRSYIYAISQKPRIHLGE